VTPAKAKRHWLVKTEPGAYSIDDLERDGVTMWDGVRNYQARNTMRDDMKPGDPVLIYHSNADPLCVAGVAKVKSESYPDPTAFDRRDKHFDPKSKEQSPTWVLVDLEHVETFAVPVTRAALLDEPTLSDMVLLQRGSRLSVQPVTAAEFKKVLSLAKQAARTAGA
jgi:predicted RNA-binding protein with PUA-like domain